MDSKRELILKLHQDGLRNCNIFKQLKPLGVGTRLIERTMLRFRKTGSVHPIKAGGRKRTVRTPKNIKIVRERIRRNPAQSMRKISRMLNLSKSSVHDIATKDLKLKAYKKQKIHGLTTVQKTERVRRSRNLLAWHAGDEIIFSDEKMFLLQDSHNQQNDRVWSVSLYDAPVDKLAVERFQNVSRVMVWGAISRKGKIPLHFVETGAKIDQNYYITSILETHLLPNAKKLYKDDYYCFQQDSAPSHKAKQTVRWLEANVPDFISPQEWPASSPDLNPLDFCVWGYMLSQLKTVKNLNLCQFKEFLVKIWDEMPMEVVRAACDAFFKRLRMVIKENGERFELKS